MQKQESSKLPHGSMSSRSSQLQPNSSSDLMTQTGPAELQHGRLSQEQTISEKSSSSTDS